MIISALDPSFNNLFNKLESTNGWISPVYTQSALKYFQQGLIDEKKILQDQSFILEWEKEPVVAFIGTTVESEGKTNLLAYGIPCHTIEDKTKLTTKGIKTFLSEFDKIVAQVNGKVWLRDYLIEGEISYLTKHLLKKGAVATPIFFKIIDLSKDKSLLWRNIRKSYSSLINNGLRELSPLIINNDSITWEHFLQFRELHIHEAGRETRSEKSWRRQFEAVQEKEAFLVLGHLNGELVSAGYFGHSETNSIYGSSASRRDLFEKPLFHAIMWTAILHAKEIGCKWFEVGEQLFKNHPSKIPPTKKELGISEFKAGFGGVTKTYLDIILDCGRKNK
jgi:hypothetical protein